MDQMSNGIQSEEFSGEKESSDQQCSLKNMVTTRRRSTLLSPTISSSRKVNTVRIGQLQAQQNKPPLSRKVHDQPNDRGREKTNSASKVSILASKRTGKASALKEETVTTQTSQSEQPWRVLRSSLHKTSAPQQGKVKTATTSVDASTRCKNSSAVPQTSTPLPDSSKKRKTKTSVGQSRPSANSVKSSSLTRSLPIYSDEPIHHITWDGFCRTHENVGVTCALCEEDLSYMPPDYESEQYEDLISDPLNYPEVSILQCGHSFHTRCFVNTIPPGEQCSDPPCVFCASFLT